MKKIPILKTDDHVTGLIIRLTLGIVILPHGCQLLFGWFGGFGFTGAMKYFTEVENLPWIVAFMVILMQSLGAVLMLLGAGSRLLGIGIIGMFIGMILKSHYQFGFFMNWSGSQQGEGFEYHLLVLGLALLLILKGSGKYSVDRLISIRNTQLSTIKSENSI